MCSDEIAYFTTQMLHPVTLFLSTEDDIIRRPSFKFLYLSHPPLIFYHRITVSMWLLEVEKAHGVRALHESGGDGPDQMFWLFWLKINNI